MSELQPLLRVIEERTEALYQRLSDGHDAPPSLRLRLEGLLEAAGLLGEDVAALQAMIDRQHQDVFGQSLASRLGAQWQSEYPFPQVPALMCRAPVVPSTRD